MNVVQFLKPAELEMLEAVHYYERQAAGLGIDFIQKVESAVDDISENPCRWQVLRLNIRRRLIHRFPYALLYRVDSDVIIILATMHLHRHPDYWLNR